MALNFNVSPYYDDFDPNKNFHRILFKPGFAVQARELTQTQTILQNQISKFADHIFQKNTPVSGANLTYNTDASYVKLQPTFNDTSIDLSLFEDELVQNADGDVVAKVIAVAESTGDASVGGDPDTLVLSYISGNKFQDGDVIYVTSNPNIACQAILADATGLCSIVSISEGVFYVVNGYSISEVTGGKYTTGHFVSVQPQTTIINKYSTKPDVRIGLNVTETIFDYIDDVSLLDPADGSPNYQGPGADRYVIQLELETRPLSLGDDDGFIELMRIEGGLVKKQVNGSVYSVIDDYFAKRTFDTNGDYIVNDFKLTPSANTSNEDRYDLKISKGVAYVRGYRLENQSELVLTSDRARDTGTVVNDSTFINYGNFVYATAANGFFDYLTFPSVDLHTVVASSVSSANANTYNSTVAATARITSTEIQQQSGSTSTYIYRVFLTDIENKTLSTKAGGSSTTSVIYLTDIGGRFSSTANAYLGMTISVTTSGVTEFRKITNYNGTSKYANLDSPLINSPTTNSVVTLNFEIKDIESIIKRDGSYGKLANCNISVLSKQNQLASGDVYLSETGVNPELIYTIGYPYVESITDPEYDTQYTFRNQDFDPSTAVLQLPSGSPFRILSTSPSDYMIILNDGTIGDVSEITSIVLSNDDKTATLNITGNLSGQDDVQVITRVAIVNDTSSLVLRVKNLVRANTDYVNISGSTVNTYTKVDTTNGQVYIQKAGIVSVGQPQSLYVSDVKKIVKIIDTKSSGEAATDDMLLDSSYDVTDNFIFDNGQRDSYYGHASIKLKPGRPSVKGNLLILFDFYNHTGSLGDGYFSISSYLDVSDGGISSSPEEYNEIPSYTAKNGTVYNLRDCVDFRPIVQNGQSNFQFIFNNIASLIPLNKDVFRCDYDYYLARKDRLILSKDKNFEIVKGTPSINPLLPVQPDGSLLVANLNLDPYTAYVPSEAPRGVLPNLSIEKIKHKRWRMSDISDMENRVNNIEYYTALNALEKNAQSLQIPDVNGLNRFKNGILVDDFSSFATADTNNTDFNSNINRREKKLTASQIVDNFPLQSSYMLRTTNKLDANVAKSLGFSVSVIGSTNMFTLPYTSASLAEQRLASNTVNINPFAVAVYDGILSLNPPMDNWVDNQKQPDLLIVDPDLQIYQSSNTLNTLSVGDWKTVPGTTTTQTQSSSTVESTRTSRTTTTTTTTQTYSDLSKTSTLGYYDKLGSTYYQDGGYITDISIMPYIRSQQILVRARGMLINTPIKCWFDGSNVNAYMTTPDYIELSSVNGEFEEDDTIGYVYDNVFLPIGKVASVYKSPTNNNVRIGIYGNKNDSWKGITKIENAVFNSSGTRTGNTAFGTPVTTSSVITKHTSGRVTGVGGVITTATNTTYKFYRVQDSIMNMHGKNCGIWSNTRGNGRYLTNSSGDLATFNFDVPLTGTYYVGVSGLFKNYVESCVIKINGNDVSLTGANTSLGIGSGIFNRNDNLKLGTVQLTKGKANVSFSMTLNSAFESAQSGANPPWPWFGLEISKFRYRLLPVHVPESGVWTWNPVTAKSFDPSISITNQEMQEYRDLLGISSPHVIFSTLAGGILSSAPIQNVTSNTALPGGGIYYSGVSQVSLSGVANTTNGFYNNCTIKFNTTNVVYDTKSKTYKTEPITRTATITNYIGSNTTAFLNTTVPISIGSNQFVNGDITTTYTIEGTANSYLLSTKSGGNIQKLSTDEQGNFAAIFNVPANTFKTGDRIFRIDNRLVNTDPTSATTFAEATFTASGLATKSQAINFSPSIDSAKNTFVRTEVRENVLINSSTNVKTTVVRRDPVCQSFLIEKENYPNGVFLRSIKLFFATKPTLVSSPVTISIVGTQNGYPNGETLDNSIVTLTANQVKVSSNPHYLDRNTYTEFVFKTPIYVQSNVLYAVLLQSPSNEYNLYTAAQNSIAIPSSVKNLPTDPTPTTVTKIGTAPYVGALFESQNSLTWTAEQGKALMFVMERCVFDTSKTPKIPFVVPSSLPLRKPIGQEIDVYEKFPYLNNTYNIIPNGDVESHAYNMTTTDFVPSSTSVNYSYRSTLKSDSSYTNEKSTTPGKFGCPTYDDIYLDDGKGERILLNGSNSSFTMNVTLSSSDSNVAPIISDDGLSLYNIRWNINNAELSNDVITIISGGTGYNVETTTVTVSEPDDSGGIQAVASANISGGIIQDVYFTNFGSGYYTTPTITILDDTTRDGNSNATFIVSGETGSSGGNIVAKYISKKVVLTPANDSGDLRVYYTAYHPIGTNILVYYKILNRNDTQSFEEGNWQLMTNIGNSTTYSKSRTDLYEYVAAPGTNNVADDFVSYTSTTGQIYTSFSQFAIKIVFTTNDKTKVPYLTDMRTIAVPSGSGV